MRVCDHALSPFGGFCRLAGYGRNFRVFDKDFLQLAEMRAGSPWYCIVLVEFDFARRT